MAWSSPSTRRRPIATATGSAGWLPLICDAFISAVIIAVAIAIATTTAGIGAIIVAEALLVVGIGAGMGTAYLVASRSAATMSGSSNAA